jgi:cyclophilin family peptidyl-prolyl cis-trans isomerase
MARFDFLRNTKAARRAKRSRRQAPQPRRSLLEALEPRHLLSTLSLLNLNTSPIIYVGEPMMVALTGSGASTMSYTVNSTSGGTATVLAPAANSVVQMTVASATGALSSGGVSGTMDFELFNNDAFSDSALTTAVNDFAKRVTTGFYNTAPGDTSSTDQNHMIFFRDDSSCLQAGSTNNTNSGGGSTLGDFDDAYDPNLVFSSPGVLAMAKGGNDGNDAQFFISNEAYSAWDFRYTIVGYMISGSTVQTQIENLPKSTDSSGFSAPTTPVLITNMQTITDTKDAALELTASTPGYFTVTVHLTDPAGDTATETINVTVQANPSSPDPPYLTAVPNIQTTANTPVTVQLSSLPSGAAPYFGYDPGTPANGAVSIPAASFNNTTGQFTVTPATGFCGVSEVYVGVVNTADTASWDTQMVPVLVTPAAPSLKLLSPSVSGVTAIDNSLQFQVTGLEASSTNSLTVDLYEDGGTTPIGTGTATGSSLTITTLPSVTITPGEHAFTATQTYQTKNIDVGNDTQPATLTSAASTALDINVVSAVPVTLPATLNASSSSTANDFTLRLQGSNVQLVNDSSGQVLKTWVNGESTTPVQIDGAAGTAEQLTVNFAYGGTFSLPLGLSFVGGSVPDVLVVSGPNSADTFTLSNTTLVAAGLNITYSSVQQMQLRGGSGNDAYVLNSSAANVVIADTGGTNSLNFSGDSAGITLNLGSSQAQAIAPWNNKTLTLQGTFQDLTGTPYADVLTGGSYTCIIRGDGGNDVLRGGSGNAALVNGAGNSTLYGGSGASLLIAGSGASTLYGGSGPSYLVGGSTSYDANDQALLSILNSLASSRMLTRSRLPMTPVASGYALVMGTTVQSHGLRNTLVPGSGLTWFLPGPSDLVK